MRHNGDQGITYLINDVSRRVGLSQERIANHMIALGSSAVEIITKGSIYRRNVS